MDPFNLNLLGTIRQQEILEEAAKGRRGQRQFRWKLSEFLLEERHEIEEASADATENISLRHRSSSLFSLLLKLRHSAKFAPQESVGTAQSYTDAQCAEC
ncbi:MAG: hypothetical protein ABI835_03485 [Chloroflexota bacterium]